MSTMQEVLGKGTRFTPVSKQWIGHQEWYTFCRDHLLVDFVGAILLQRPLPNAGFASSSRGLIIQFLRDLAKRKFVFSMRRMLNAVKRIVKAMTRYAVKRRQTICKLMSQISHGGTKGPKSYKLLSSIAKVHRVALHAAIKNWQPPQLLPPKSAAVSAHVSLLLDMAPLAQQYKELFFNPYNLRAFSASCRLVTGNCPRQEAKQLHVVYSHRLADVYMLSSQSSIPPTVPPGTYGVYYNGYNHCLNKGLRISDDFPEPVTPPGTPADKCPIFKQLTTVNSNSTTIGRARLISYATRKRYVSSPTGVPREGEKVRPKSKLLTQRKPTNTSKPSEEQTNIKGLKEISLKIVNKDQPSEPLERRFSGTLSSAADEVLRYSPMPPVVPSHGKRYKKVSTPPNCDYSLGVQSTVSAADTEVNHTLCTWRSVSQGIVLKSPSPFGRIRSCTPTPIPPSPRCDTIVRGSSQSGDQVSQVVRSSPWLSRKIIKNDPTRTGSHIVGGACRQVKLNYVNNITQEDDKFLEDSSLLMFEKATIHSKRPPEALRVKTHRRRVVVTTKEDIWKKLAEITRVGVGRVVPQLPQTESADVSAADGSDDCQSASNSSKNNNIDTTTVGCC